MDAYQQYIHKSRYARYFARGAAAGVRWEETVNRYGQLLVRPGSALNEKL